ncbi:sterol desaturase family protein [Accumulibacter sp.]|uniref:sterol desaturase family protein n=1 Tax=Accumulibacter sp. TaxID=2053492 RepID=UPI0025D525F6|nr:sterol desaturase family protein [Accumulibacter sp.]MCM8595790.1 sterol desaturase family protein [Accumulibacter sp.]MCM8626511.1 sterol desaturase family protein [Accumulibacter sp.]MDS4049938.1 sterol desaturase family protein [Accumulibacter sp.]
MIEALVEAFVGVQAWLLDRIVQPPLLALGLASHVEMAFDAIEFFLAGVLQISVAFLLLRPLEALRPIEVWPDRRAVRVDVLYSLLDRLGIIPLFVFALLAPLFLTIDGWLRFHDIIPPQLEDLFPGLETRPLASFLVYLVVLDFAEYWRHRLSHTFGWWWALHAIHHTQRQMTLWTDSRNHLLDDLIGGAWFAVVALIVGVPPGHFVGLLIAVKTVENLAHVNARLSFGRFGELLLVSPRYHRWHHALELPPGDAYRSGCNFAVLFPVWDQLFKTQYRGHELPASGLTHGPLPESAARSGFWRQQCEGIQAMVAALAARRTAPTGATEDHA